MARDRRKLNRRRQESDESVYCRNLMRSTLALLHSKTKQAALERLPSSRVFRYSGHQTFPLRIAWLPKAVREIASGRDPLSNIDEGIVSLGLGKNMVESLRCW